MPLPTDAEAKKLLWPPAVDGADDVARWAQWYSGNFVQASYAASKTEGGLPERLSGGYVHRHAAGSQRGTPQEQPVHAPLAADIAMVSADLLFGDWIDLTLADEDDTTQNRLDELVKETGMQNTLLQGAEGAASLGGVYLRISWDADLWDVPFISLAQADQAVPTFAFDRLVACTFWKVVAEDQQTVWRHLERHERGREGSSVIYHGLYKGTKNTLGTQVTLDSHEATRGLTDEVLVPALPGGLACYYVPNVRPNRRDAKSPMGRADIQGSETMLDALDEVYSSLMRDFLLGRRRIIVPDGALEKTGEGRGAGKSFDPEKSVFTELEGVDPGLGMKPELVDFAVRTTDHLTAAVDLVEKIVSAAGYSPQTFGLQIEGRAESGTALRFREQKTFRTLERKRRYWQAAVAWACEALLVIDRDVFGRTDVTPGAVDIEWPAEPSAPLAEAQTIQALRQAEAISVESAVKQLHPDWSDEDVDEEVAAIMAESGRSVPNPLAEAGQISAQPSMDYDLGEESEQEGEGEE